ncbi:MAG TPA: TatD family hydrolase [Acidimicrobiales bacterium]|nr:TatD family hydrolase [Acidimicrobiales bacterium]
MDGPAPWFDSHCHLQDRYRGDPDGGGAGGPDPAGELVRARAAGVGAVVCVGTDAATSAEALALARAAGPADGWPARWATVGLHPHEASSGTGAVTVLAEEAAGDPALVAVGECGLDYHYEHSPRPAQRTAFAEQIALARRLGLTLVVHAREAWDDLFDVLAAEGVPERCVLHCFTGGPEEARRCLAAGMFVSFSGIVTFKNASDVRAAAELCPLDRLLVETDSPFLAPVPHRGRPNEPAYVPLVGAAVAEVRGMDPAQLAATSDAAARAAFGLAPG